MSYINNDNDNDNDNDFFGVEVIVRHGVMVVSGHLSEEEATIDSVIDVLEMCLAGIGFSDDTIKWAMRKRYNSFEKDDG